MMPPVDVPAMRSKYRANGRLSRYRSSRPASRLAVNVPRMPPPSIERIRNWRPLGHSNGTRRHRRAPDDRRGGKWVSSVQLDIERPVGVPSSASPSAGSPPALVACEPVYRPRDDGIGDDATGVPVVRLRVVQTERWSLRILRVRVNVRNPTLGIRTTAQQRINNPNTRPEHVCTLPGTPSPQQRNSNAIALGKGPELPLPTRELAVSLNDSKPRPADTHSLDLPCDAQAHSAGTSPKCVCFGVALEDTGLAARLVTTAGTTSRPVPDSCRLWP